MLKRFLFILAVLSLCVGPAIQAADIVLISETTDNDGDGVQDDQQLLDWLVAQGHNVDVQYDLWTALDADKLATLNAADLVLVSRTTTGTNYAEGDEATLWNSVTTPLIQMNASLVGLWSWVDPTSTTNLSAPPLEIITTDHPVLDGVTLSPLDPNDPNSPSTTVLAIDATVGSGQSSYIDALDMGNGTLIAQAIGPDANAGAIAQWDKAVEFYEGAGQIAAATRLFFAGGTQEANDLPQGAWNFTAEGEKMFQNAVNYMISLPGRYASTPTPTDGTADLLRDEVMLTWKAGSTATAHDVYLGTNLDSVVMADGNDMPDVTISLGQTGTTFDPGRLAFGQTYYWRVDEIDQDGVYKGDVWSLTIEPEALVIENVTVMASSTYNPMMSPEKTIDGSGLDTDDLHTVNGTDMWLSDPLDPGPVWIQYEFEKPYKLLEMWVWNSNTVIEPIYGYGLKDVTIEYSMNGTDWTVLKDVELAQASGWPGLAPEAVALDGVGAQYVRITANSNWGGGPKYGLSEVRFFNIPLRAREPQPVEGQMTIPVDATLTWRSGREAAVHKVYLSSNRDAVANSTALVGMVSDNSFNVKSLELDLERTYYWKINEVNDAADPSFLDGEIWEFKTQDYFAVDDFESYTNSNITGTWTDSWKTIRGVLGGCGVTPVVNEMVLHSGGQSMLLEFDNSTSPYEIEVVRGISGRTNWTKNAVSKMVVSFHGDLDNNPADKLSVTLNGKRVNYGGNLTTPWWQQWTIEINASLGIDYRNITQLRIGVGDVAKPDGHKGKVYIDDIRLYRATPSSNNLLNAVAALNSAGDLAGQLDTLITAVMAADPAIVTALTSEEVYTLFLPTDDAFATLGLNSDNIKSLDSATLTDILLYHVAEARLTSEDVLAAKQIEMASGGTVQQSEGMLIDTTGRPAAIVTSDVEATNGLIHVIDSVLFPYELRNIVDLMTDLNAAGGLAGQFEAVLSAIEADPTVLGKLTDDNAQYTVLVPTNEVIAALQMDADTNFLLYHIASGKLLAADILATDQIEMLNGDIVMQADGMLIDTAGRKATLVTSDIEAANGVIHIIDATLWPAGLVTNPSFELPGEGKLADFGLIPGWSTDANVVDSGVETGWGATDGEYTAFLMSGDPSIWQLTGHTIAEGDVIELKVDARITWQATTLRMILYYEVEGARVPLATSDVAITDDMQEYTLSFTATDVPESVGSPIGIEFANVSEGDSWLGLDYVRLNVSK